FFKQMPFELEEAAQIDGCTPAQAFRRIILPLAAPGVFTTAILVFIAAWNEFIIAVSVVNKSEYKTANVIVSQFTGQYQFQQPYPRRGLPANARNTAIGPGGTGINSSLSTTACPRTSIRYPPAANRTARTGTCSRARATNSSRYGRAATSTGTPAPASGAAV